MLDYCTLDDLECPESALAGVVPTLWVIRKQDVLEVPQSCSGGELLDPVKVKPGTRSHKYKFLVGTVGYREGGKKNGHGTYAESILEGYRSRIAPDHMHEICKLMQGHYILQFQDENGYVRVLGTLSKPMQFIFNADTGKGGTDKNGVLWRFYGVTECPIPFLDKTVQPPNEEQYPIADIAVGKPVDCVYLVNANGSYLSDGTAITASTPGS